MTTETKHEGEGRESVTINEKLQQAEDRAFEVDRAISSLFASLQEAIGDLQGEKRPHEAGILIGASGHLRDSFYRKLGGLLQDMQR